MTRRPNFTKRCAWANSTPLMTAYHDREWGVPVHSDRRLFEFLVLESVQAGLSWQLVLNKRKNYRKALHNFDPVRVARYSARDIRRLLTDSGIIRNRPKIEATIINARRFLEAQDEFGSFDRYIWRFVGGKPVRHRFRSPSQIPTTTRESDAMSREMKARGFRFVGATTCYAFMQAVGMVNDHTVGCFRYNQV
ncbi:MAG: DNA-3-methyladenine glycosylase I [Armatimonadota bacterium]